uniref:Uncharacterized protein n=1 Tax=Cacopsylla melanoneura TaxID=428564 RepID=A0A8D8RVS3_9HEMI
METKYLEGRLFVLTQRNFTVLVWYSFQELLAVTCPFAQFEGATAEKSDEFFFQLKSLTQVVSTREDVINVRFVENSSRRKRESSTVIMNELLQDSLSLKG